MNALRLEITFDENLLTARSHKTIMNKLYRFELEEHRRKILPRHFMAVPETQPNGAYGYKARSRKWERRKQREGKGAGIPNVYTGGLRDSVLKRSIIRATANSATLTAKNHDPNAAAGSRIVNTRHGKRRFSNKVRFALTDQRRKEIEAFSNREKERLAKDMKTRYLLAVAPGGPYRRKRAPKRITASGGGGGLAEAA